MAITVVTGDNDSFGALLYGATVNPNLTNYIQNKHAQFQSIGGMMGEAANSFITRSKELYDRFYNSDAIRKARLALERVSNVFRHDEVYEFRTMTEFQSAMPVMQRYIMAEPTIRQLYHDQRIDGYADTYVDMHPGKIGVDHYDYRRVTDGMIMVNNDPKSEFDWTANIYLEDLVEGDRDLLFAEQVEIMNTWDRMKAYVKIGDDDPTNPLGGKM